MKIAVYVLLIGLCILSCRKENGSKQPVQKAIAFKVQKDANTVNLWYVGADGLSFGQIIPDNIGSAADNPAWSSDGRRVYFVRNSQNKGENGIYCVRPNGSELTTVYKDNAEQLRRYYQICSDNRDENIVFSLEIPRTGRKVIELYTMCPCGDRVVRLTQFETENMEPSSTESYAGSFSPEDSLLVFTQSNPDLTSVKDVKIYTLNMRTKELKRIKTVRAKNARECVPSFSPSGGRMLLSIDGSIHTMNNDGSDLKPLGSLKGYHPSWDRDGKTFYFSSYGIDGMEQGVYSSDINLTNIKRITRSPAIGMHGGFSINF